MPDGRQTDSDEIWSLVSKKHHLEKSPRGGTGGYRWPTVYIEESKLQTGGKNVKALASSEGESLCFKREIRVLKL